MLISWTQTTLIVQLMIDCKSYNHQLIHHELDSQAQAVIIILTHKRIIIISIIISIIFTQHSCKKSSGSKPVTWPSFSLFNHLFLFLHKHQFQVSNRCIFFISFPLVKLCDSMHAPSTVSKQLGESISWSVFFVPEPRDLLIPPSFKKHNFA